MDRRKIIISLLGGVVLIGGVMLSRSFSGGGKKPAEPVTENAATVVRTVTVTNGPVNANIRITGRVIPEERVELFAEVTGVSSYGSRSFKAGNAFKKGQVLLRIDSRELASSLASSKSQFMSTLALVLPDLKLDYSAVYPQWKNYLMKLSVNKPIPPLPDVTNEQLKLFLTGRNVYASYYAINEAETRLSKYTIRAPFNGTLTESNISQGTLVRVGQLLGEYIKDDVFELEGSVLFHQLKYLETGQQIEFTGMNDDVTYKGKVVRINEKVDPTSQLVKLYVQLKDAGLRSGLYLEGNIAAYTIEEAVELPIQALIDNQFVYVITDGKAIKQSISVVEQDADSFIARGIPDGAAVIIDKKNSAFEGSAVITM